MSNQPEVISSRDNPLLRDIRKLQSDPVSYRKLGRVWLEGDHLVSTAVERGWNLRCLVLSERGSFQHFGQWPHWAAKAQRCVSVPDELFAQISSLESPAKVGALLDWPAQPVIQASVSTLVLDRVQDAGNVGSMLRSASAFGVRQVLALKGTAGLWSAKVLRAGMGAHFSLRLAEGLQAADLDALKLPLLATSPRGGLTLGKSDIPTPCAWVLGHEGQGVSQELMARCMATVSIPQPGGGESLNVAAAAAVCLFATRTAR